MNQFTLEELHALDNELGDLDDAIETALHGIREALNGDRATIIDEALGEHPITNRASDLATRLGDAICGLRDLQSEARRAQTAARSRASQLDPDDKHPTVAATQYQLASKAQMLRLKSVQEGFDQLLTTFGGLIQAPVSMFEVGHMFMLRLPGGRSVSARVRFGAPYTVGLDITERVFLHEPMESGVQTIGSINDPNWVMTVTQALIAAGIQPKPNQKETISDPLPRRKP